ncbi:MAG: hypothetical protein KKD25_12200 [Gammaproteobacteria bacterium]|nr:hypothetical protein [Gammaproteobacteria bacterium]MBU0769791.1 hypothetical protein [Gammaproteobacteria bacterium]MBU0855386.1 hypothetical protein [Gammaproteobacteria bacterium]MBU1845473.1 hypothetical protein [Gammaproteobacteria bacterium]
MTELTCPDCVTRKQVRLCVMHAQSVDLLHTLFDGFDRHHVPDRYRHDGGNFVGRGAIHHNALERSRDHDDEYRPAVPVNAGDAGPAGDAAPGNQRGIKLAQQEFEPVLARRQAVIWCKQFGKPVRQGPPTVPS